MYILSRNYVNWVILNSVFCYNDTDNQSLLLIFILILVVIRLVFGTWWIIMELDVSDYASRPSTMDPLPLVRPHSPSEWCLTLDPPTYGFLLSSATLRILLVVSIVYFFLLLIIVKKIQDLVFWSRLSEVVLGCRNRKFIWIVKRVCRNYIIYYWDADCVEASKLILYMFLYYEIILLDGV